LSDKAHWRLEFAHRSLSDWVHPRLNRWITVREAARLQSFHDGFIFRGSEWQQLKQIGDAVPPWRARALGTLAQEVLAVLDDDRADALHTRGVVRSQPAQQVLLPA
jgi:DNA (cytosine-5)-methyltransferase 1